MIVDLFAGGGGASLGIWLATGRHPDVAIDHSRAAVAMHTANHPTTRHLCEDVFDVEPRDVVGRRRVDLLWASPDCTHHSRAKGGKPRERRRRALASGRGHPGEFRGGETEGGMSLATIMAARAGGLLLSGQAVWVGPRELRA